MIKDIKMAVGQDVWFVEEIPGLKPKIVKVFILSANIEYHYGLEHNTERVTLRAAGWNCGMPVANFFWYKWAAQLTLWLLKHNISWAL